MGIRQMTASSRYICEHHFCRNTNTSSQIHQYKYINTNTSIQIHQYKYINTNRNTNTNTPIRQMTASSRHLRASFLPQYKYIITNTSIQIHQYKYINTNTSIQI